MIGSNGWLETEWQEGKVHESGIPDKGSDCIRSQSLHSSEGNIVMGVERREAGRWMREDYRGSKTNGSGRKS